MSHALVVPSVGSCKHVMPSQVEMNVHGTFFLLLVSSYINVTFPHCRIVFKIYARLLQFQLGKECSQAL